MSNLISTVVVRYTVRTTPNKTPRLRAGNTRVGLTNSCMVVQ